MKKHSYVNKDEAPIGFYAIEKNFEYPENACNRCDARKLCNENKDNWCLINRCMSYEVIFEGKTYGRKDGCGVVFKSKSLCN